MSKKKKLIRIISTFIIFAVVFMLIQRLLMPKYVDDVVEGNLIKEYYQEENKDYDVIFIGDCEVYETSRRSSYGQNMELTVTLEEVLNSIYGSLTIFRRYIKIS